MSESITKQAANARARADLAAARADELSARLKIDAFTRLRKQMRDGAARVGTPRRGGSGRGGALMASGSYGANGRGAGTKRTTRTTVTRGGSADYHLDAITLRDLRRDSSHAYRTNPAAALIVETLVDHVVGDGVSFLPQHADKGFNDAKKKLMLEWAGNAGGKLGAGYCDARGPGGEPLDTRLAQIVRDLCTDGAALEVFTESAALAAVEAERFTSPQGPYALPQLVPGKDGWVNGVHVGGNGELLEIGVGNFGPDGSSAYIGGGKDLQIYSLVDGSAMLLRSPIGTKRNQVMGEPAVARILDRLDRLDAIDDAVLENFRIVASLTAIITSPNPAAVTASWAGQDLARASEAGSSGSGTDAIRDIEAGMINVAGAGTDLKQMQAVQPSAQYNPYMMYQMGICAAYIGCPWILALMDGSVSNYSGFRAAMSLGYKRFYKWREMLSRYLHWIEKQLTARWISEGKLALVADWDTPSTIQWPPMPVLDPKSEIEAGSMAVEAKIKSRKEVILEITGRSIADVDREIEEEGGGEGSSPQSAQSAQRDAGEEVVGGRMGGLAKLNGTLNGVHH